MNCLVMLKQDVKVWHNSTVYHAVSHGLLRYTQGRGIIISTCLCCLMKKTLSHPWCLDQLLPPATLGSCLYFYNYFILIIFNLYPVDMFHTNMYLPTLSVHMSILYHYTANM